MASFNITLFPIGERVLAGGKPGVVAAWAHIGPSEPDVVHVITLDEAVLVDGGEPIVSIEAPASQIRSAP